MSDVEPEPEESARAAEEERDHLLMSLVAGGDEGAFRELVERHHLRVMAFLQRMLGTDPVVEDLAQEVFVRVWKSAARYRPRARFTTWLHRITRNAALNEIRSRGRRKWILGLGGGGDVKLPEPVGKDADRPDQSARGHELARVVEAALLRLPAAQREALILHRFEQMPHYEVAEAMQTSVSAVKSLIFRARETLKAELAEYLE